MLQTEYPMISDLQMAKDPRTLIGKFPAKAHEDMSDRYVHIDTNKVVAMMADMGFSAASTRHRSPNLFGMHQVDFIRSSDTLSTTKLQLLPRISFINSNDGSARAKIIAGIFRMVCSNGLMAGNVVASDRITHIGDQARDILERIRQASKEAESLFGQIDKWSSIKLDREQSMTLATQAAEIRFPSGSFSPSLLLQVRRQEDVSNDLWTVFNRIQENAMKGGLPGATADGRRTMSRPLTEVRKSMDFNQQLWDAAESLALAN